MGMNMQMITRGWLVLRLADDSPLALALVMMTFALPVTFVSPIAGVLADRVPRKHIIMFAQSGNAVLTLLVGTLDITGVVTLWHLMVIGVFNGSMMALNMPSRQAIISDIVPDDKLMNAISLNNSAMNLTRVAGPAVAGVLIVFIDTAGVFYLITGVYVYAVLSMAVVNAGSTPAAHSRKGMTGDIREGLAYAASDPRRLGLIIMAFIPGLFGYSYFALLPAWAREALDVQSDDLGVLMMVIGLGALVGTLMLASMGDFNRRGSLLLAAAIVWGITLAAFSQTTSYAVAVPLLLVMGMVNAVFMSLSMTLMQLHSAPEMRGRVMSLAMMTFGVMPLSAVPFGAIAEHFGTPDALGLSGLLLIGFTLLFAVGYPSVRKIA